VKATFKIEINDEEKKVRDTQQTTVYHTGGMIELDEEDRKELEKERLADVDELEHEDDDEEEAEMEADPDEDLNF
jgi:hypothetical protein